MDAAIRDADEALAVATTAGSTTMLAWAHFTGGEVRLETAPPEAANYLGRRPRCRTTRA